MPKFTLITGPQRTECARAALELAAGRPPVGVLVPDARARAAFILAVPDVPCQVLVPKHPPVPWESIIVIGAGQLGPRLLCATALTIDRDADLYLVDSPPGDGRLSHLLSELAAAGVCTAILTPTLTSEAEHP